MLSFSTNPCDLGLLATGSALLSQEIGGTTKAEDAYNGCANSNLYKLGLSTIDSSSLSPEIGGTTRVEDAYSGCANLVWEWVRR